MKKDITRRDFLKLSGALPIYLAAPRFFNSLDALDQTQLCLSVMRSQHSIFPFMGINVRQHPILPG